MSTMNHVRYLAETIGPRGSTTQKEKAAAQYASQVLEQAGLKPVIETFESGRSSYSPYALFSAIFLVGVFLFWIGGRWGAIVALLLSIFAIASVLLELTFRPNPFRWLLPKGKSQNVWARIPPQEEEQEQVVLLGHLDTNRTPLLFSSNGWVKFMGIIIPLGLGSALLLTVLFVIGSIAPRLLWPFLSLPFAVVLLVLLSLMLQADFSPYSPGANDNATGAASVLRAAEKLAKEPLIHTTVWTVLTGCEEVGCYGAESFAQAHRNELGKPIWIPLEYLGGIAADPAYILSESFLLKSPSDPNLIKLADQVANQQPELKVHSLHWGGAYTDGAIGAKHGFRILTIASFRRDGSFPEWHRTTDTVDNVDVEVLERSEKFLWSLLQGIDKASG
jgi:hypothetical protein